MAVTALFLRLYCLHRLSHIECCSESCSCGSECQNQAIRRQQTPQTRCDM